jgi:hypothetical protein
LGIVFGFVITKKTPKVVKEQTKTIVNVVVKNRNQKGGMSKTQL